MTKTKKAPTKKELKAVGSPFAQPFPNVPEARVRKVAKTVYLTLEVAERLEALGKGRMSEVAERGIRQVLGMAVS